MFSPFLETELDVLAGDEADVESELGVKVEIELGENVDALIYFTASLISMSILVGVFLKDTLQATSPKRIPFFPFFLSDWLGAVFTNSLRSNFWPSSLPSTSNVFCVTVGLTGPKYENVSVIDLTAPATDATAGADAAAGGHCGAAAAIHGSSGAAAAAS